MIGLGMGMGISVPTLFRVIVERVDPRRAGLVGGLTNSTWQASAALAHAFTVTMLGVAACHLIGASLGAGLGQSRRRVTVARPAE